MSAIVFYLSVNHHHHCYHHLWPSEAFRDRFPRFLLLHLSKSQAWSISLCESPPRTGVMMILWYWYYILCTLHTVYCTAIQDQSQEPAKIIWRWWLLFIIIMMLVSHSLKRQYHHHFNRLNCNYFNQGEEVWKLKHYQPPSDCACKRRRSDDNDIAFPLTWVEKMIKT